MIDNMVIVDAVVHPWNMSLEDQNPAAQAQVDAVYASHKLSYDEAHSEFVLQPFFGGEVGALEGVTGVTVVQTLDKLWTPDRAGA